ncbi:MAG: hypothetical protein Q8M06_06900 [Methanobacteriaceae archaeon]|nr:hypothetical protein [Methanobacteriaceae archaeon]
MDMFFAVGGAALIILSALLLYTTRKIPENRRNTGYLAGLFCLIIGFIALFIGFR